MSRLFERKVRSWTLSRRAPRIRTGNAKTKTKLRLQDLEDRTTPTTFVVNNTGDSGTGTLRQAITDANNNTGSDSITFDDTVFSSPQTILLGSPLSITDNLTITGPGSNLLAVDGGGAVQVMNSSASILNLSGFTIQDGSSTSSGGGLLAGGTITMDDMVFNNNTASGAFSSGGAIFLNPSASLTLSNSTISGNTAGRSGGGIYFFDNGSLVMDSSTVSGNSSTYTGTYAGYLGGGGIYFFGSATKMVITNSTIANNTSAGSGGGIMLEVFSGTLEIQDCTISGNTATTTGTSYFGYVYGGGGVAQVVGTGVITVTNSVISGNTNANAQDISSAGIVNVNYSAIFDANGFTLTGGNNLAFGTDAKLGPLQDNGGLTQTMAPKNGSPLIDAGSNSLVPAGVVRDQRGLNLVRIFNGTVDIGAVEDQPVGIPYATTTPPIVTAANAGQTTYQFKVTFADSTGANRGINVSTLINNNAVIRVTGPNGFNQLAHYVSINNGTNGTPRIVTYSIVPPGGSWDNLDNGIYAVSVEPNTVFDLDGNAVTPGFIAFLYVDIPPLIVYNADDSGPGSLREALLLANAAPQDDVIQFEPSFFSTPQTVHLLSPLPAIAANGGALVITGPGAKNLTIDAGGQFRVFTSDAPDLTLSGMTVKGGLATNDLGGGLLTTGHTVIDSMVFTGNTASSDGSVDNQKLFNWGGGGAIATPRGASAVVQVLNSTISGNTATNNGGGIFLNYGSSILDVENSTISGNSTTRTEAYYGYVGGAGISISGTPTSNVPPEFVAGTITIRNSTIAGNTTAGSGGGIGGNGFYGTLLLQNTMVTGNSAAAVGASTAYPSVVFGGGGIQDCDFQFGTPPTLILQNSVVSGNINVGGEPDISWVDTTNAYFSAIGDDTGISNPNFDSTTTGLLGADLQLGPLQDNGGPTETVAPMAGSPLIDAGSNALLPNGNTNDQRGFDRIFNGTVDIGPVEFQPPQVTINQSITQADPTNGATIQFTVVFNMPVTGFDGNDIDFTGSTAGGTLTATVIQIGPSTYTVNVSGMTSSGTVVASVVADAATNPTTGLGNLASTSTDNTVTYDITAPTVTVEQAVAQVDPTKNSPITFDVVFSEPVLGFTAADISFAGSTLVGLSASIFQTGPTTYTVSVTGMNGEGDVVVSIPAATVTDLAGNNNSASTSNDNRVHFDNIKPNVTITGVADPQGGTSATFNVLFSEAVSGFTASDITISPSSTAGGTLVASISGAGPAYTVTVTGMTTSGTVVISIGAGTVTDLAGNANNASNTATVNYVHSGTLAFSVAGASVSEHNDPLVTIEVDRIGGSDGALSVNYATGGGTAVPGTNYDSTSGTLTWLAGDTTPKFFTVQVHNDHSFDGDHTVDLTLSSPSLFGAIGSPSTETLTITDWSEGTISITGPASPVSEGSLAKFFVTRTNGANGPVSIDYSIVFGTAFANDIGTPSVPPGPLNWADGVSTPIEIDIPVLADGVSEGSESLNLKLTNPGGGALLGTTPAVLTIDKSNPIAVNAANKFALKFTDTDQDSVTVKLNGKLGSLNLYMTNGVGPIAEIDAIGTDQLRSSVSVTVAKAKKSVNPNADGKVSIGAVIGTALKSFSAAKSDLVGTGFNMSGYLGSLKIGNVLNGADIITIGGVVTQKTTLKLGVVGDGTTINIANPIGALSMTSFGDGAIVAPSAMSITTKGRPANAKKGDPGDPGNFNADVTLSGAGVLPKKATLGTLSVKGGMSNNDIDVTGSVGTIRVRGNVIGSLVETTGALGKFSALTFQGSRLFVGYNGPDDGIGGSFNAAGQLGTFTVTGKTNGFQDSHVIASSIKSASLASVNTSNSGIKFGFIADVTIGQIKVKSPAITYAQKVDGDTPADHGDFRIRVV